MIKQTTAILLFSRTAAVESTHKFATSNITANKKLWNFLYKKTLRTLQSSSLPLIVCNEQHQAGNTFGEKMANALSEGFASGYDNLIVVGSDCVDLSKAILQSTCHKINNSHQVVVGPDCRGGVYLFAINKSVFNKTLFTDFAWQTKQLFKQFKNYGDRFSLIVLPRLHDINVEYDLLSAFNKFSIDVSWRILLSQIVATNNTLYNSFVKIYQSLYLNSHRPLRAPPLF